MQEELTTKMHAEFIGDDISDLDLRIMAVYGAISRGTEKESALREYGLTEQEYNENIDRVLSE